MSSVNAHQMVTIIVLNREGQEKERFDMRRGANLWVFLRKQGLPIGASCSGVGVCAACTVEVVEAQEGALTPMTEFEQYSLTRNEKMGEQKNQRISCLCRVFQNISIKTNYW